MYRVRRALCSQRCVVRSVRSLTLSGLDNDKSREEKLVHTVYGTSPQPSPTSSCCYPYFSALSGNGLLEVAVRGFSYQYARYISYPSKIYITFRAIFFLHIPLQPLLSFALGNVGETIVRMRVSYSPLPCRHLPVGCRLCCFMLPFPRCLLAPAYICPAPSNPFWCIFHKPQQLEPRLSLLLTISHGKRVLLVRVLHVAYPSQR